MANVVASQMLLVSVVLPPHARAALTLAGFKTVGDVLELRPSDLSRELGVPHEEALLLQQSLMQPGLSSTSAVASATPAMTALQLLHAELARVGISTLCTAIDSLFGSGIPTQKVTEFCGAPGIGKTQLAVQLAVNVCIPASMGGVSGQAVYIDTEGSFIVERVEEIAQGTIDLLRHMAVGPEQTAAVLQLSVDSILEGIHYFRVHDFVQQLAVIEILPGFLTANPNVAVRLLVIDSIAFHFRQDFSDIGARTRMLNGMGQSFQRMASEHNLAVVLINQMTTKFGRDGERGERAGNAHLVPALGESFAHQATNRVILCWENSVRNAILFKSPSREEKTVSYQVTSSGLRDLSHKRGRVGDHETFSDDARAGLGKVARTRVA